MAEITEDNLMKELYKGVGKSTKDRETLELITVTTSRIKLSQEKGKFTGSWRGSGRSCGLG